jgi:hypothetical protein
MQPEQPWLATEKRRDRPKINGVFLHEGCAQFIFRPSRTSNQLTQTPISDHSCFHELAKGSRRLTPYGTICTAPNWCRSLIRLHRDSREKNANASHDGNRAIQHKPCATQAPACQDCSERAN